MTKGFGQTLVRRLNRVVKPFLPRYLLSLFSRAFHPDPAPLTLNSPVAGGMAGDLRRNYSIVKRGRPAATPKTGQELAIEVCEIFAHLIVFDRHISGPDVLGFYEEAEKRIKQIDPLLLALEKARLKEFLKQPRVSRCRSEW